MLFCCLSEIYTDSITSQLIIDAVVFNIKASPLFNIIVEKREVGCNLRAAWWCLLLLYQEMQWQPWCAIFVMEITPMMTFGYFILSLRQLTRLPVCAKFTSVKRGTIIDLKW